MCREQITCPKGRERENNKKRIGSGKRVLRFGIRTDEDREKGIVSECRVTTNQHGRTKLSSNQERDHKGQDK